MSAIVRCWMVTLASALALVAMAGCRQISSIESTPEPPDPTLTCGDLRFASSSCAECVGRSCCDEAEACNAAGECGELARCLAGCGQGDGACSSRCRRELSSAFDARAASLLSCEASHCAGVCGLSCGGYVYPDAPCAACGTSNCCAEARACMDDAACARLAVCQRRCSARDGDCARACELAEPSGVLRARAFGTCIASSCSSACVGPEWTCLQTSRPPTPPATGPSITLTYSFVDYETFLPIPGLRVRACGATDIECTTPLVLVSGRDGTVLTTPVTTDTNGQAVLRLGVNKFDGYVEVANDDYGPILDFHPLVVTDFVARTTAILRRSTLLRLAGQLAPMDPTRGTLIVTSRDCTREPAAGVAFALEPPDAVPFYFSGRIPSIAARQTDAAGGLAAGGFVNVRANTSLLLRANVVSNELAFSRTVAFVRPGAGFSLVTMLAETP